MQEDKREVQNKETEDIVLNSQVRDSGGKIIFGDNLLCSQFLRDYVDIPGLKNVTSEDIEDVSDQFVPLFAEERNADRVKRVHLKKGNVEEPPFFLVSLIEHKTYVEYNVCMQIFRYMVYIWEAYEKEMEKLHKGISRQKGFRYPPILPIVYYEGRDEWTAPMDFKSRVNRSDVFGEYIPDFKYYLVPIQKYSNDELLSKEDEISLIMMINKMQTLEDVTEFRKLPTERVNKILANTPVHILDIITDILMAFQLKANVPVEEAEENAGKVREKNVARLFENADLGDVQARRREMAELKEQVQAAHEQIQEAQKLVQEIEKQKAEAEKQKTEAEKQKAEAEKQKAEAEKQKAEAEKQKTEAEKQKEEAIEKNIEVFIDIMKSMGQSRKFVLEQLLNKFGIEPEDAEKRLKRYWG